MNDRSANPADKAGDRAERPWTSSRLRRVFLREFRSQQLVVVSNRQPYSHDRLVGGEISVRTSAGGMITAIAPVMCSCSGIWVAHGSGSGDREAVDANDRVRLPPETPAYALRRVWLSADEQKRYYEGFSNEGLWPLCHTTPVLPRFRRDEWRTYKQVNRRFAEAVLAECGRARPFVFIQDYHLALLPQLLRGALPGAVIALFWHVPWPTPERLLRCPWWGAIIKHMLGADVLGFNTPEDCRKFLAAARRIGEFKVAQSSNAVFSEKHVCRVLPYPESIEWPPGRFIRASGSKRARSEVRGRYGISSAVRLGLSVDRCDFTKGIPQRLRAVEKLFESSSRWRGKFTLLQFAVPSRSSVPAYRELQALVHREVERINARFATATWKPVVLVQQEQRREYLPTLYRSADLFLVNSLHDGMNLVAKEFVAARNDEDGVLILSKRAGAAHELLEALLIDPLDIQASMKAIEAALCMPRGQRRGRMRSMRRTVEHNNVYKWAGEIICEAAKARQRKEPPVGRSHDN